ncbi:hypothetical protein [Tengunoibacter tsumagoiensis]|nr:hypothetical protein [Tengunoibacter tsumagoiensis]
MNRIKVLVRSLSIGFVLTLFALIVSVQPVFADGPLVTGAIIAGLLTEVAPVAEAFTGSPGSTATYTIPITVSDLTGGSSGWKLSITSTTFATAVGGNTLPTTASTITGVTATCTVLGSCSLNTPTNTVSTLPAVPAGTTPPTPVVFFDTTTARGIFTVTPTIAVAIPSTANLGTYLSTVTLSIATGP